MFLHGGWIHLIGNMWTLWIFGDNVEDEMGPWKFLIFYLTCGLFASAVQIYTNPDSVLPTIGASGAIAGVMGAYYVLFPRARIIIMIPILFFPFFFEIPAVLFLAFWFLEQLFSGAFSLLGPKMLGGIAWWAHIGGFLCGMTIYRFFLDPSYCRRRYPDHSRPWGLLVPRDRY
jgi:membrane associated rhomboid family serine protease